MELGDNATYLMKRVGSISFNMPSGDVLKLNYVSFVLVLKKNILSIFCVLEIKDRVALGGQHCTTNIVVYKVQGLW